MMFKPQKETNRLTAKTQTTTNSCQSRELDQRRLNTARRTTGAPFARFKFSSGIPTMGLYPMKTSFRLRKA